MTTIVAGFVPRLRGHPHTDLARGAPCPVDLGVAGHDVADVHRNDELQFVDNSGHRPATAVPRGNDAGSLVDEAHDRATVHVALQVGVKRVDDTAEPDT